MVDQRWTTVGQLICAARGFLRYRLSAIKKAKNPIDFVFRFDNVTLAYLKDGIAKTPYCLIDVYRISISILAAAALLFPLHAFP